jgi:hypothetical protein
MQWYDLPQKGRLQPPQSLILSPTPPDAAVVVSGARLLAIQGAGS